MAASDYFPDLPDTGDMLEAAFYKEGWNYTKIDNKGTTVHRQVNFGKDSEPGSPTFGEDMIVVEREFYSNKEKVKKMKNKEENKTITPDMVFSRLPLNKEGDLIKKEFSLKSPRNLVFISQKKTGKTLTASNQPKILILDCEGGTKDFGFPVNNKVDITKYSNGEPFTKTNKFGYLPTGLFETVDELRKVNNMDKYWELFDKLDEKGDKESYDNLIEHINKMPFPIVMLDTTTSFIDLSNQAALEEYNSKVKIESRKTDIKRVDEYGGVRYIRAKFDEVKRFVEQNAAPFIIHAGHIAEKKKVFKKSDDDISTVDIDLEGILSKIFTVKATAIGIFFRDKNGCFLDFTKKDESDTGNRAAHLSNKVVKIADFISSEDLEKGKTPKTYWSTVFPELKF
jgi:hypothetical protein